MCVPEMRIVYTWRTPADIAANSVQRFNTPSDAAKEVGDRLGLLRSKRGCLDAAIVHPREAFKAAVLRNAASLIVADNHPSGDPTPAQRIVTPRKRSNTRANC